MKYRSIIRWWDEQYLYTSQINSNMKFLQEFFSIAAGYDLQCSTGSPVCNVWLCRERDMCMLPGPSELFRLPLPCRCLLLLLLVTLLCCLCLYNTTTPTEPTAIRWATLLYSIMYSNRNVYIYELTQAQLHWTNTQHKWLKESERERELNGGGDGKSSRGRVHEPASIAIVV